MSIDFRERGRGREKDRNIDLLRPVRTWTEAQTQNLGMCPDQEPNLKHFGVWDDAPTNWATRPGLPILILNIKSVSVKTKLSALETTKLNNVTLLSCRSRCGWNRKNKRHEKARGQTCGAEQGGRLCHRAGAVGIRRALRGRALKESTFTFT